jgi:AraC-like DNA-binding protein
MQKLQFLIDMLTRERKIHISILDVSGILSSPTRKIIFKNVIHSKEFCNIAKSTEKGHALCLRCKKLANTKAISDKTPFCGHCRYGIYEAAMPVVIDGAVAAIVYVGNAVTDINYTKSRIDRACLISNVDKDKLYELINECEQISNEEELLGIAEILSDYIKMLHQAEPKANTKHHWLVSAMMQHAEQACCLNPTLKELSVIYHKNEKYMGRLFKREIGTSFHAYCLRLRLKKAKDLLLNTSEKVIDVALECGFNNISYFNRTFKEQYGMPPTEFISSASR